MKPFDGETPLQVIARQADAGQRAFPSPAMSSLERFPYYTAFPFSWYPIALGRESAIEGCNLVCPYHWWEWAPDGTNAAIPYSERTNKKAKVRSYPTIERNGLVMFLVPPRPEPGAALADPPTRRVPHR